MSLPPSEVQTAKEYHLQLEGLSFKPCGFRHEFSGLKGETFPLCVNRESENLGCAHVRDQAIRSTITFLTRYQIFTEQDQKSLIEVLGVVNAELGAIDTWAQELDSMLRDFRKLDPLAVEQKLGKHGLTHQGYNSIPAILRKAPQEEQVVAAQPKIYLNEKLKLILKSLLNRETIEAKQHAKELMAKITNWFEQDDTVAPRFDWSVN